MAKLGNTKKLYIQSSSSYTVLTGETSSSFNLSADMVETSDKTLAWKTYIAGYKGGTVDATVYADSTDAGQKAVLAALFEGTELSCFIGEMSENSPSDGFGFAALVASIGEPYEVASAIARSISLQITGEVTPYPSL